MRVCLLGLNCLGPVEWTVAMGTGDGSGSICVGADLAGMVYWTTVVVGQVAIGTGNMRGTGLHGGQSLLIQVAFT